jgi:hypothetical protein
LIVGEQPALADDVANGLPAADRCLGDVRSRGVADVRAERGREGAAAIEEFTASVFVDAKAGDAAFQQHSHRLAQDARGVQGVPGDHRHHHVELELPRIRRGENRRIAAEHLETDLIHHLRH